MSRLTACGPYGMGSNIPFHSFSINKSVPSAAKVVASVGYLQFYFLVLSIENRLRVFNVQNTTSFKL